MGFFSTSHKHESDAKHTPVNFWPATSYNSGYGQLADKDTEWSCVSDHGFQTETQVWYNILEDGSMVFIQVIWSFLGMTFIPATAQMTFKIYNPNTKTQTWKSINVKNFKTEGRGCKSDSFEIKHTGSTDGEEVYAITATLDQTIQINATFTKPATAPGYKYGPGPNGGISTYNKQDPKATDVFVFHRFHPLVESAGSLFVNGAEVNMKGQSMFVHAQQAGMRPNVIASRWNFAFFTTATSEDESTELGKVRAIQMEFQTTDAYGPAPNTKDGGRVKVNIGCIYSSAAPKSALLAVGQTHTPMVDAYPTPVHNVCTAEHRNLAKDVETGYDAPHAISFQWAGDRVDKQGDAKASIVLDTVSDGLIAKVSVLEELPVMLRKAISVVTGAKPYIFQYHNPATLQVETGGKSIPVKGWVYNEASFVSL